jgi:hypothetical protein
MSPTQRIFDIDNNRISYRYIRQAQLYFFVVFSIINETLASKNKPLDPLKSVISQCHITNC